MVTQLTETTIEESTQPVIIKAFASWCSHCATMKPIFEELEKELGQKYIFTEFDIDEDPELTKQFNVSQLPTFIFIKNNTEVDRIIGETSKSELKENIEKHLG